MLKSSFCPPEPRFPASCGKQSAGRDRTYLKSGLLMVLAALLPILACVTLNLNSLVDMEKRTRSQLYAEVAKALKIDPRQVWGGLQRSLPGSGRSL